MYETSTNPSIGFAGVAEQAGVCLEAMDRLRAHAALRNCLERLVAGVFQVDETLLSQPTRGRADIARARQVAMYLAHTVFELSLTETGLAFNRDRTTVSHACLVVEDGRDDPAFDRAIEIMERSARILQVQALQAVQGETAKGDTA
ncbi:MAG: helix-turn-helix domain-containing protein [Pseudomonadota bacterium]